MYLKNSLVLSKPNNNLSTFLLNNLTTKPGYAFDSCNIVGISKSNAAFNTGAQIYPPVPITTSGLNSSIISLASLIELIVLKNFIKLDGVGFNTKPYASICFRLYPALETKSFSSPIKVPIKEFQILVLLPLFCLQL